MKHVIVNLVSFAKLGKISLRGTLMACILFGVHEKTIWFGPAWAAFAHVLDILGFQLFDDTAMAYRAARGLSQLILRFDTTLLRRSLSPGYQSAGLFEMEADFMELASHYQKQKRAFTFSLGHIFGLVEDLGHSCWSVLNRQPLLDISPWDFFWSIFYILSIFSLGIASRPWGFALWALVFLVPGSLTTREDAISSYGSEWQRSQQRT